MEMDIDNGNVVRIQMISNNPGRSFGTDAR